LPQLGFVFHAVGEFSQRAALVPPIKDQPLFKLERPAASPLGTP
jgi:hypothetical protein